MAHCQHPVDILTSLLRNSDRNESTVQKCYKDSLMKTITLCDICYFQWDNINYWQKKHCNKLLGYHPLCKKPAGLVLISWASLKIPPHPTSKTWPSATSLTGYFCFMFASSDISCLHQKWNSFDLYSLSQSQWTNNVFSHFYYLFENMLSSSKSHRNKHAAVEIWEKASWLTNLLRGKYLTNLYNTHKNNGIICRCTHRNDLSFSVTIWK